MNRGSAGLGIPLGRNRVRFNEAPIHESGKSRYARQAFGPEVALQ